MAFCLADCVGLTVDEAKRVLSENGIKNVGVVYNLDRKQSNFDKEIVTAVRQNGAEVQLVVCRYLFAVQ